ncbi:NAD(P)H-dependent glycerol-3-phosphate dehydrogenase [Legionella impletisoli]|uniref:Glycerol-3-phosphate dehydrogenase [NAD(P)+] n=1 Tax=Legionella impletisoli TaxID=343510 RepID=A0A917JX18_9GAMM|nr:NAD(P)H-dependent glycerol-3-phosphate dehydrogenase [Legionella impletisoli]GGI89332.1 glycerol-3-phosphate dehydrogenase [NAD(P)+] [Legionella impletisoli]
MKQTTVAILGAGSWGTAVAIHLAHSGHRVLLWGHNPDTMAEMQQQRCNVRYLPGIHFPENLMATSNLEEAVQQTKELILAVPSHAFRELLAKLPKPTSGLAWLTKGIDPKTRALLSELVHEQWENCPIAVISGPSFAKEVAQLLPTALVVAGKNTPYVKRLCHVLHHRNIRVYQSDDVIGVQICGAVKNVLAIACGISDGLNYGANAKAALITRGLAEMSRLGISLGAQAETFMGLAGVGDLVLTCTDDQSRNRRFGLQLGQGANLRAAEAAIGQVVEGKHNAAQVVALAKEQGIEMPICHEVNAIIQGKTSAEKAVGDLMSRPPKAE